MQKKQWYIGIDEVGRGALAGPVMVGVFAIRLSDQSLLRGYDIRDSKQMSAAARGRAAQYLDELAQSGTARYAIAMQSAEYINNHGIVPAIRACITEGLQALVIGPRDSCRSLSSTAIRDRNDSKDDDDDLLTPFNSRVYLDGGLRAPAQWLHQSTHVRGDDLYPVISAASILAKVTRDEYMHDLTLLYPQYAWDRNVGYGTAKHRAAILDCGMNQHHRTLFCRNLLTIQ